MFKTKYSIWLGLISYLFTNLSLAQSLAEGVWQGSLTNALGKRYTIIYNIEYHNESQVLPDIVMINMDLEPTPDFTYVLQDIELNEQFLNFKIPRNHDNRICKLQKQQDQSYSGTCQSDMATQGETSEIMMSPPASDDEI